MQTNNEDAEMNKKEFKDMYRELRVMLGLRRAGRYAFMFDEQAGNGAPFTGKQHAVIDADNKLSRLIVDSFPEWMVSIIYDKNPKSRYNILHVALEDRPFLRIAMFANTRY